jgi:phospholipase B1
VEGVDYQNDWKMINIQIGSNDMCGACNSSYINDTTPEKFGSYVEAAVKRIKDNIPKVLVNLIGTFNVSEVFPLRAGQSYCLPLNSSKPLCPCAATPGGFEKMDNLSIGNFPK